MILSPAKTRDLLRRAVVMLHGYEDYALHEQWTEARRVFLVDLMAALGVDSVEAAIETLAPKKPIRGPDRAKRKSRREADKARIDSLSASVAGSGLSQLDRPNPSARSNDDVTDVDLVAAVHTLNALRFQQMSL